MRENGALTYKTTTGGGIDPVTGDPIASTSVWSDPVPCMIIPNSKGFIQKYDGGAYIPADYEIHIEPFTDYLNTSTVRITDDRGRDLGEHSVVAENIRYMDIVQRIKILI
jgi:hypothetical protein